MCPAIRASGEIKSDVAVLRGWGLIALESIVGQIPSNPSLRAARGGLLFIEQSETVTALNECGRKGWR